MLGLCILRLSCLGSEPVTGFCFSLHERFGLSITLCMGVLNAILIKRTRVVQDCVCVLTTVLIAIPQGTQWQIVGIGTVIMALGLGPALTFLQEKVALPFYEKIGVRETTQE